MEQNAKVKKVGVALLGLGVVGGGTYEILKSKREYIAQNDGVDIEVVKVLDKNAARIAELGVEPSCVAKDIDEIVNDERIQIVAEFFGGVEPARTFLLKALEAGKSIVTANKEMFSKHWHELEEAAEKSGAGLYFEASCVGGVPVIRTLTDSMQGNKITSLKGIVNGTTNYILSRMSSEGIGFDECLKEAQRLGYAEANPTADVDGFDATYKNSILSSLAYKTRVPVDKIFREGIRNIDVKDIEIGKRLGYTLKLLAISTFENGKLSARVHPAFLPSSHPLAAVSGPFNALYLHGDSVDDVMLYGRGAGALPTGSAIVSDIVFAGGKDAHRHFPFELNDDCAMVENDFSTGYYLRLAMHGADTSKILALLDKNGIPVKKISSEGDMLILVTGNVKESVMQGIVCGLKELASVKDVCAQIRVEM